MPGAPNSDGLQPKDSRLRALQDCSLAIIYAETSTRLASLWPLAQLCFALHALASNEFPWFVQFLFSNSVQL